MKYYIIISYEGSAPTHENVTLIATQIKAIKPDAEDMHAVVMNETEVNSAIVCHAESRDATKLSVTESACIYVKEKFGKFFDSKMKLLFALTEAVNNEPNNESLMNAIKIISGGSITKKLRDSYGISSDVIYVFKSLQNNM